MINFDALPSEMPSNGGVQVVPAGEYVGVIQKAEMKTPKDLNEDGSKKPNYLNITWECYDKVTNQLIGRVFDNLTESTSPYVQAKLRKFIEATRVQLGNQFELSDLCKVIQNKKCFITINVKDDKSQIDIFNNPYLPYTVTNFNVNVTEAAAGDVPFAMNEPTATSDENY